jgi:hypothetical protein
MNKALDAAKPGRHPGLVTRKRKGPRFDGALEAAREAWEGLPGDVRQTVSGKLTTTVEALDAAVKAIGPSSPFFEAAKAIAIVAVVEALKPFGGLTIDAMIAKASAVFPVAAEHVRKLTS